MAEYYVFPDGDIQPINYILSEAEKACFEIRDVENLREHYALSLKSWLQRLESQKPKAIEMLDKTGYRLWRIYLASSRWLFESGSHGLHQTLLYKLDDDPTDTHLPLQRSDWYRK
ncbi:MAG: class I SAM-dependent methyltransferase [Anaerolineae bacterium]|nr:class I SAM-dependent methyltransferase [Anaerolineae bacterium]MDQ7035205.1 class I SAM-dependent methyltransferase [Anaerolineae bacterium]